MKILLVASLADSLINFRGSLIDALQAKGVCVHVAAPDFDTALPTRMALQKRGVNVHQIYMHRAGMNPLADIRTLWSLWRLMSQIKPKYLLVYTIKPVIYGCLAGWIAGVPRRFALITGLGYAFTGQAYGMRAVVQWLARVLYKFALRHAHAVIFQNCDDQELFRRLRLVSESMPTVVVNGSGVDTNAFQCIPLPQGPCRFLMIARLLGDKGVREYAQAAKRVRVMHPEVTFGLVGWIDNNPDSIKQTELDEWVSDGSIHFYGRMDDVRPALAACTIYVLPSYREGMPRSVLEAMSTGRPIITTHAPGCRETVIHQENGLLVPVQSVDALVDAMMRLISDPAMINKMASRSRQLAELKYDVHQINMQMIAEMNL